MRNLRHGVAMLAGLVCLAPLWGLAAALPAASVPERQLINAAEVHDEIRVAPGTEAAVKDYFPSFLEYQDLVMFHPKFGYYASGRVNFWGDYQTFPIVLAPYFGQMIAHQIFAMWDGMRRAGTLGPKDVFTIAEFGAGDGTLAESILDYLEEHGKESPVWREFAAQVLYVCYDRSPALSKAQRKRNARFGKRFEAREADATDVTVAIPPATVKGVVLSNELPDAFSVHKVILSTDGSAEVAFVAPSLAREHWEKLKKDVPLPVVEAVEKGDRAIKDIFFSGKAGYTYLTKTAFVALLEALVSSKDYASAVDSLEFSEVYVPARLMPELDDHLRRFARLYATELAKSDRGVVTYVNPGVEKFIQGAGHILNAGYVVTIDYGASWAGVIAQNSLPHLRTYGPAHYEANSYVESVDQDGPSQERETSDPYRGPTLNDMTTDVNFSLMAAAGRLAGLKTVYFGPQAALQAGTPVSLNALPAARYENAATADEFWAWAENFHTNGNYRVLVQQKDKTDAAYVFPEKNADRLESDPSGLTELQRQKAAAIEKRLGSQARPAK